MIFLAASGWRCARLVYYDHSDAMPILVLTAYARNARAQIR